ncbi:MAG: transglycosylase SLT domain-containing protein [Desulfococcaceae bacterium]|jgi:membrane-bound lytic murein transglycosylase C|nr:transglycosylase SLT domain-containing protein [Desulfococcaceae bacterium]
MKKIFCCLILLCILTAGCAGTEKTVRIKAAPEAIARKWDTVRLPGTDSWVDYSPDLDTRGQVDFVRGKVALETVIPLDSGNIRDTAEQKIVLHALRVLTAESPDKDPFLKGQIRNRKGDILTDKNMRDFITKEIVPGLRRKRVYVSKDGVKRVRIGADFDLLPNHIEIRAKHYMGTVRHFARKMKLDPALIMAMIHAESHFNPMARSPDGALGLMQLMPPYGAKEAYGFLYRTRKILPEAYFYDPARNIELGTTYYYLLKTRHFHDIPDNTAQRYIAVCAYNWGPGRLRRLVRTHALAKKNGAAVYSLLQQKTPAETAEYLKDVMGRYPAYEKMLAADEN